MTETQIVIVAVIVVLVAAVGPMLFVLARAGGPLAVETGQQLEIVRRRMKVPVSATLQVTGISEPSFDAMDCTGVYVLN